MTRSRATAKSAGTAMETAVARYLAEQLNRPIERRTKRGNKDCGDIAGVTLRGKEIVIEAKNCARTDLPGWTGEAHVEADNASALVGVVVAKRHGVGITTTDGIGRQWVHMTLADLATIIRHSQENTQ